MERRERDWRGLIVRKGSLLCDLENWWLEERGCETRWTREDDHGEERDERDLWEEDEVDKSRE